MVFFVSFIFLADAMMLKGRGEGAGGEGGGGRGGGSMMQLFHGHERCPDTMPEDRLCPRVPVVTQSCIEGTWLQGTVRPNRNVSVTNLNSGHGCSVAGPAVSRAQCT